MILQVEQTQWICSWGQSFELENEILVHNWKVKKKNTSNVVTHSIHLSPFKVRENSMKEIYN